MRARPAIVPGLLVAVLALAGCRSTGNTAGSGLPGAATEPVEAARTIRQVFGTRLTASGLTRPDLEVTEVTPERIVWKNGDRDGDRDSDEVRILTLADIELIDRDVPGVNARDPETIRILLRRDSGSVKTAAPRSGIGFGVGRPQVVLKDRPLGSHSALCAAIDQLRDQRRAAKKEATEEATAKAKKAEEETAEEPVKATKPATTPETPADPTATTPTKTDKPPAREPGESVERRLEQLRDWHKRGLITQEDYDQKRKAILEDW